MLRYREIVEMRSIGLSLEKVAFMCGCSIEKAKKISNRASMLGLQWPVPIEFSEAELQRLLDPQAKSPCFQPDCKAIFDKLQKDGYSKRLTKRHAEAAWEAYLDMAGDESASLLAKDRFRDVYAKWHKQHSSPLWMRINWTPAEEIQVDWAGSTLPIYGKDGEQTPAYLFVATSPYSDYTFVRASLDMSMQSWLEHHRHMFEFFGGVPLFLAPDNLLTGVTINPKKPFEDKRKKHINAKYKELADHYGTIVMPTRVRTPRDKGAVESHVKIAAGRIIGTLSHLRFTSIDQLNYAISEFLDVFNEQTMDRFKTSRKEIFQKEKPFFSPLPEKPFVSVTWLECKASPDAVVRVRGVYYGIPENYANQKVVARISDDRIDIFTGNRKQALARHIRRPDGSETFEGFAGRRPDRFKPLSEWAAQNDRQTLLDQWHPTKNEGATPHDVVCRSMRQVWWQCADCGYEWQETPHARVKRDWDDCLACANVDLISGRNDLASLFPGIAAEWHPTKNGRAPSEVFPDYGLVVWWVGSECGHEWKASVRQRTSSTLEGLCPYCSGREALPGFNDVATLCPELAELWHPSKNRERKPEKTPVCSTSRVYLWNGALSDVWLESPRAWMLRNGYEDVIEGFESLAKGAKASSEAGDAGGGMALFEGDPSKARIKSSRYSARWTKGASLEEWCSSYSKPEILSEWHPAKNEKLTPKNVAYGSDEVVWWLCPNGHEWRSTVADRALRDRSCPICKRRKAVRPGTNDLASCKPGLLKWYSSENGDLKPSEISDRSARKVKWECPHCGAKWQRPVSGIKGDSLTCPVCTKSGNYGRYLVRGANDLATKNPLLAAEWHPTKNGSLTPRDVLPGAYKRVWWQCENGHEWQSIVNDRSRGSGCPYCESKAVLSGFNDLATAFPNVAAEWHPTKNGNVAPTEIAPYSNRKAWWRCSRGHEWETQVSTRTRGAGCPVCSGRKVLPGYNDLATTHPDLAAEWHPEKNGDLRPDSVAAGSHKKAWWVCQRKHEWQAEICFRTHEKTGCPVCSGRRVLPGYNDLATTHPEVAAFWHPTKNGGLSPKDVTAGSGKEAWWLGECGHEWRSRVLNYRHASRVSCPYCTDKKLLLGFNDLATTHPKLAEQWHPSMNAGLAPQNVTAGSGKEVWWLCSSGHVWKEKVRLRAKGSFGCPYCSGRKAPECSTGPGCPSGAPSQPKTGISLEEWCKNNGRTDLLKEWHSEKNGELTPGDILAKSGKRAWWMCECGHEWQTKVRSRTAGGKGTGCPFCSNQRIAAGFNDLATTHPELAAEWHPTRNGSLRPADVMASQNRKVWWLCADCGYEWETQLRSRRKRLGCPNCKKGKDSH